MTYEPKYVYIRHPTQGVLKNNYCNLDTNYMVKKEKLLETETKIRKFILKKIDRRKYQKKPLEMRYLHVGKATGTSYKQVRRVFDMMIQEGSIEKFVKWQRDDYGRYYQINFYRRVVLPSA